MKFDLNHTWLPYTQHNIAPMPLPVVDAYGCVLKLADGRELIDGISSWWTVCHGYKHPHLVKAVQEQASKLAHVMFAGLAHEQPYILAERLAKLTGLERVFFSDSGSTAVEVALKMATQYWKIQNKNTRKQRFVHFTNSYHGDTMGAMSVSDNDGMHSPFVGFTPMQFMVDIPSDEIAFNEFDALLAAEKNQIAAVILEPLVQGAGGMKFHSPDVLAEIYRITKKHDLLFIADEIATGFGRTGYMFACAEAGIVPDIMCIGKALTGGMMTLAATCASAEVFATFNDHAFMHGPTYMGNALACAAANASLDLFEQEPRLEQVAKIENIMQKELAKCRALPIVKDVRVKGAFGVVQLDLKACHSRAGGNPGSQTQELDPSLRWDGKSDDNSFILSLRQKFIAENVWLRPFGDVVYIAPPFVIEEKDLKVLTDKIYKILSKQK